MFTEWSVLAPRFTVKVHPLYFWRAQKSVLSLKLRVDATGNYEPHEWQLLQQKRTNDEAVSSWFHTRSLSLENFSIIRICCVQRLSKKLVESKLRILASSIELFLTFWTWSLPLSAIDSSLLGNKATLSHSFPTLLYLLIIWVRSNILQQATSPWSWKKMNFKILKLSKVEN